ncbi:ATP-binding protein [Streptosporangium sp. NPDC001559]|uniref:ATP-binding protein n=1 Tax=Streptosporangium sp. NPDC001559 TaxID=3366187 RepID=UPI0036EF3B37
MEESAPDPRRARTVEEFMASMRALRAWSGLSYRQLARRARTAGQVLPPSTLAALLQRDVLPREEALVAFVSACGLESGRVARWTAARRRLSVRSAVSRDREGATPEQDLPSRTVPRHLPRQVGDFTGREPEVTRLLEEIEGSGAGVVVIDAIDGMAGVGKTALAVHAAHRLAGRYPDGQLYVNLHAHTPGRTPLEVIDALGTLLRMVGVGAEAVPATVEEAAALWRTVLAERRMVIVLDDATGVPQVWPLLPGTSGCRVLITSRRRLVDLDDAVVLSLAVLTPAESAALLTKVVGAERSAAEPQALAEVAALCGHLPLALRVAGARLLHRPTWTVAALAQRLRHRHDRLRELRTGDRGVETAFTMSYEQLSGEQRRMFRLLGLVPGDDIDVHAAAALTGLSLQEAEELLEELVDVHLAQQPTAGRFTLHDLLRQHARSLSQEIDAESERVRVLDRLHDFHRHTAAAAVELLARPTERFDASGLDHPIPDLAGPGRAAAWLEAEYANLVTTAVHAAAHGRPDHALRMSALLFRPLHRHGRYQDGLTLHSCALRAAHDIGDDAALSRVHYALGGVYHELCDSGQAAWHAERALLFARAEGEVDVQERALTLGAICVAEARPLLAVDRLRQALLLTARTGSRERRSLVLCNLAVPYRDAGLLGSSLFHASEALVIGQELGDLSTQAAAWEEVGVAHLLYGRLERALLCCHEALTLIRQTVYRGMEASILDKLSMIYRRLGNLPQALASSDQALILAEEIGDRRNQMAALTNRGLTCQLLGRHEQARRHHLEALRLAHVLRNRKGQSNALNAMGELCLLAGAPAQAAEHHRHAMALLPGNPLEQARGLTGIAMALLACGRGRSGRRHLRHAEHLLTS